MRQRGRKSGDATTTVPVLIETRRPAPPAGLSDTEKAIWRDTVGTLPLGWFARSEFPILAAYCRHAGRADALGERASGFGLDWLKEEGGPAVLDQLLKMAERETKVMLACARSLRLTKQAQMHPRTAGRAMPESDGSRLWHRPWDPVESSQD